MVVSEVIYPHIAGARPSFLQAAFYNAQYKMGAALLEHYVCVISPVEAESLSPDVAQVMSVSVRWPWRSGLHGAACILVPDGMASRPQNRHCSTATADAAPLRHLSGSSA